jgi:transglutaminase-like putative cysteine protease
MHSGMLNTLRVSTGMMILCGYLALYYTPGYGVFMLAIAAVLLVATPVGSRLDLKYEWYRRASMGVSVGFLLILPILFTQLGLMRTVLILVAFVQAHRLVHQKTRRDYLQIMLMSFFMVVGACTLEPTAGVALVLIVYIVFSILALIGLEIISELERTRSGGVAHLKTVRRDGTLHMPHARGFLDAGFVGSTSIMVVISLLMTAGLFMAMPRMEAGMLGGRDDTRAFIGLDDTVTISGGTSIAAETGLVMLAKFPEEPDGQYDGDLMWRAITLPAYTEEGWRRGSVDHNFFDNRTLLQFAHTRRAAVRNPIRPDGRRVVQEIFVGDLTVSALPVLQMPLRVEGISGRVGWDLNTNDFTVVPQLDLPTYDYRAISEVWNPDPGALRSSGNDPRQYVDAFSPKDYGLLTAHNLSGDAVSLTEDLLSNEETIYDKAVRVESWLRGPDFLYALEVPELDELQPVEDFLFQVRIGHCELFATTMALMLRTQGIPTRVVSGYRGGDWSVEDRGYLVDRTSAHVWVEVYFLDQGWVSFDPSPPATGLDPTGIAALERWVARYSLLGRAFWNRNVIGYRGGVGLGSLRELSMRIFRWDFSKVSAENSTRASDSSNIVVPVFAIFIVLFLSIGIAYLAIRSSKKGAYRHALTEDQRRAIRLYDAVLKELRQIGIESEGKTAGELRRELRTHQKGFASEAIGLIDIYTKVRFGARELTRDRYQVLIRALRNVDAAPG